MLLVSAKCSWKKECISGDKKLDSFFLLFVKVYQYVESSKDYNKYLNSVWKRRFLKLLCLGFFVYVGFGGYNLYKGAEKMSVLITGWPSSSITDSKAHAIIAYSFSKDVLNTP